MKDSAVKAFFIAPALAGLISFSLISILFFAVNFNTVGFILAIVLLRSLPIGLVYGYLAAFFLGVPAYLIIRRMPRLQCMATYALLGFLIGSVSSLKFFGASISLFTATGAIYGGLSGYIFWFILRFDTEIASPEQASIKKKSLWVLLTVLLLALAVMVGKSVQNSLMRNVVHTIAEDVFPLKNGRRIHIKKEDKGAEFYGYKIMLESISADSVTTLPLSIEHYNIATKTITLDGSGTLKCAVSFDPSTETVQCGTSGPNGPYRAEYIVEGDLLKLEKFILFTEAGEPKTVYPANETAAVKEMNDNLAEDEVYPLPNGRRLRLKTDGEGNFFFNYTATLEKETAGKTDRLPLTIEHYATKTKTLTRDDTGALQCFGVNFNSADQTLLCGVNGPDGAFEYRYILEGNILKLQKLSFVPETGEPKILYHISGQ